MAAALSDSGWDDEIFARIDAYTLMIFWNITENESWTLYIVREKRQPLVSVGIPGGMLLLDRVDEGEFAVILKERLERLAAVRAELEAKASANL